MPKVTTKTEKLMSTTSIEDAVRDGRMNLSEYLRRYEQAEFDSFNVTLVRETAQQLEARVASLVTSVDMLIARNTFADHGEA